MSTNLWLRKALPYRLTNSVPLFQARGLLGELARLLAASGAPGKVHLTVEDDRAPAIALYESLGMRRAISLRGYRGPLG